MGKAVLGGPESTGVGSFSFGAFGEHASTPTAQHDSTINVTVLVDQEGALDIAGCFSYAKHSTRSGFNLVRIAAAGNPEPRSTKNLVSFRRSPGVMGRRLRVARRVRAHQALDTPRSPSG